MDAEWWISPRMGNYRLGEIMAQIIVNADDFGVSAHTVDWTIKGFETGVLTSATIMANMPETATAIEYAKTHPQFSFGIHLYLSDELPLANGPSSMIDPKSGRLWQTRQFMVKSLLGLIRIEDVKKEIRAQYDAIRATGLKLTHFDGHGHMHRWPISIRALADLKDELGLKLTRRCQDLYVVPPSRIGWVINKKQHQQMARYFKMPDHFIMAFGKTQDVKWFEKIVAELPDGVTEIGIHPGVDTLCRKIDTAGAFALQDWHGHKRLNYNDL